MMHLRDVAGVGDNLPAEYLGQRWGVTLVSGMTEHSTHYTLTHAEDKGYDMPGRVCAVQPDFVEIVQRSKNE